MVLFLYKKQSITMQQKLYRVFNIITKDYSEQAAAMCGRGVNMYPLNAGFVFPAGSRSALAGEAG